MELLGAIPSREWNSLNGFLSSDHYESNHDHQYMAGHNFLYDSAVQNYDINPLSTTGCSNLEFPMPICTYEGDECYSFGAYSNNDHHLVACDTSNSSLALCDEQEMINGKRSISDLYLNVVVDDHRYCSNEEMVNNGDKTPAKNGARIGNSKKRSMSNLDLSSDHDDKVLKSKRSIVRSRKNKRCALSEEERDLDGKIIKESIGHENEISQDIGDIDSCSSKKHSATVLNLSGKSRASRGSATDPQSLYARRRREKINERLRTLQNLVPNGTKVDISTMLEDAVQYVKFLQLQIKLLSSDDLWMYAPLAYNGMNVGINLSLPNPNHH